MNKSSYSFLKSCLALAVLLMGWSSANAQCQWTTIPSFTVQCNSSASVYIQSFSSTGGINNITNNNTNCGNTSTSYSAYTNMQVTANAGSTVTFTVQTPSSSNNLTRASLWIDWNQNNDFEATEEYAFTQLMFGTTSNPQQVQVSVPVTAKNGLTRMRVRAVTNGINPPVATSDPCATRQFGETEDYGFEVINPCLPPDVLSISNVDFKSAEISWSEKGNARLYEYVLSLDPNFYPSSAGYNYTSANQRFLSLENLICDTTYYVYVRCVCDTSASSAIFWDTSTWKVDSFTTEPCCYDPNPTINNITSTTAIGRWDPVGSAYGYEYAVSVQNTPPQAGTYTTYTSAFLQGLMSSQIYYLHVRSRCSPTPLSDWKSVVFATNKTLNVSNVNGSNVFEMTAFPNPVSDNVTITVNGTRAGDAKIYVTDLTGKTLSAMPVTSEVTNVDMSAYPSGIYIVKYADDAHNKVLKVSKQ